MGFFDFLIGASSAKDPRHYVFGSPSPGAPMSHWKRWADSITDEQWLSLGIDNINVLIFNDKIARDEKARRAGVMTMQTISFLTEYHYHADERRKLARMQTLVASASFKEILALSNKEAHDLYQSEPYLPKSPSLDDPPRTTATAFLKKRAAAVVDREERLLDDAIRGYDREHTTQIRAAMQRGLRFGDLLASRVAPPIRLLQNQRSHLEREMNAARQSGFDTLLIEAEIERSRHTSSVLQEEQRALGLVLAKARREYREAVCANGVRVTTHLTAYRERKRHEMQNHLQKVLGYSHYHLSREYLASDLYPASGLNHRRDAYLADLKKIIAPLQNELATLDQSMHDQFHLNDDEETQ